MPTIYKAKKNHSRGKWSEDDLNNAARVVENGQMSIYQASKTYDVPWLTLKRRITSNCLVKKSLGPPSLLGEQNEKKIVLHIKKIQRHGFCPTRNEVRILAYKLAEQLHINHKFNRESGMAGLDWLHLFFRRNPKLSIRKSEGVSQACSTNMNNEAEAKYFNLLQDQLIEHDLLEKPGNCYNVDETGLELNSKSVTNITACCNGEGIFLPPACF
ncbi:CENP-B N-terminal DNA-binding domain [Popillia japonica]|uniref:CENP-B N-terminal DNA-binding domain n=1 Tax=Popillia japonica TaxID=7064 RepID=A0AAW1HUI6_POPJA